MKRIVIIALFLVFLSGCQENLPPTPPPPGADGVFGRAMAGMAGMPAWAAPAKNIAITPEKAYYGDGVVVAASNFDYIYMNGYVFNSKVRSWEKFTLQGEQTKEWLRNQGIGSVAIDAGRFEKGNNYLVVYACSRVPQGWDCNENKWMLIPFQVLGSPTGEIPEMANIDQFVINAPIVPFAISATTAEEDNFNEIQVIRYDARYKEPNGLVVLVHVFDFNNRAELDQTVNTLWRDIVVNGWKPHIGHNLAVFLDEKDHRDAVWTSGKQLIFVETFDDEAANKEIIEAYLQKYPSDLQKPI